MNYQNKSKGELIKELKQLRQECLEFKKLSEKNLSSNNPKEDYLTERCKMFHDAQKLAHIGIWEWEKESDHVIWSDELFHIAALDSRYPAPTYADHAKIYTPQSWHILNTAIENALKTGESYQLELEMIRPDGTIRNVSVYGGAKHNASKDKVTGLFGLVMDETERKQTEDSLRRSEERNRLLSSVTMEGILIHKNGIAIDLNHSLAKILGYEYNELLQKNFLEIVHVDDRQAVRENIVKEYAGPYEVRAIRKNGELFNIEIESKNFQYHNEQWRVSAIRDITVRKQAEELQRTMAEMLDIAPSSITVHDTAGRFLFANQRTFELHGCSASEFMAMNLHALDVPESEALLSERFRRISESGFASFEVAHYHKDGHTFPLEVNARTVEWRGRPAVLSIATDITERKRAEAEIKKAKDKAEESEERFRNYIQNSPTAVFLSDKMGKYTFVNNSACNLLGYTMTELLQLSIPDLLKPDKVDDEIVTFLELKQKGEIRNVEKKLIRKDSREIDVILDGKKLSENEYIAFVKDITERKQAEEEIKKAKEKAEESDRLKSAFLANMSHEIRTPMNGILGFAELLKAPNLSGDEQKEYIRIIEKSGARMLNTINEIVDISKIEAGLVEIDIRDVSINELMHFAFQFFKSEVEAKGIMLSIQGSLKAQEVIIKTDKEKLHAILFNLIKNAVKYTRAGSVEFGFSFTTNIAPSKYPEHGALEFFVKDTGIGIPIDRQKAIFERFIQADVPDKNAYQGAGLGLSISKAYVEMLGGRIWVESEVGKGSTFYFTIPYNPAKKGNDVSPKLDLTAEIHDQIKPQTLGLKILLAEDDETSEWFICEAIKAISKEILKAKTGIQAIDYCRNNPDIDLVLMDIKMPEMDGYEAVREIREFNKEVIIIAQTAHGLTGDREKALAAGCNDYISKPVKKEELLVLIQKVFASFDSTQDPNDRTFLS